MKTPWYYFTNKDRTRAIAIRCNGTTKPFYEDEPYLIIESDSLSLYKYEDNHHQYLDLPPKYRGGAISISERLRYKAMCFEGWDPAATELISITKEEFDEIRIIERL